jgi:hypothetical protein
VPRRDGAQPAHAGDGEQVQAAAEQHGAEQHQPATPAQRAAGRHVQGQQTDGEQAERVVNVVLAGRVIDSEQVGRQAVAQAMRAKRPQHYRQRGAERPGHQEQTGVSHCEVPVRVMKRRADCRRGSTRGSSAG